MPFTDPIPGFNPNAGAPIAPTEAEQWTANYRNQPQEELAGRKRTKAYYFGNQLLDTIQQLVAWASASTWGWKKT
ncbi:hypothetical protein ACFPAF_15200 [Hymenobacter endophyticus]|uniref:Uncharacterized protein n=1 Tax=Hymenobacter endophyticus TaxID=3076335 RepID=A0ABU3TK61_9BACT|nr:hypothetical protein [Hymenobacter endophyticus]MDU0371748.1 hypothetical protein [Hymenobacter endophyticus]